LEATGKVSPGTDSQLSQSTTTEGGYNMVRL
jgi:hypothetical protein